MNYGTAVIGQDMFVFGGRCDYSGKCCHNGLYALNTYSKVWRKMPCTDGPMEKYSCGFISYSYQGTDYLLALGGRARKQPTQQRHSLYIPCYGDYYTNEIHTMEMNSSQGKWNVPKIKGERPLTLSSFTLDVLPNDRSKAILFGGEIASQKDKHHYSADLYLLTLSSDTVEFKKLSPWFMSRWPEPRYRHSSTVIKSYTDSKEQSHLLVMGGCTGTSGFLETTIADCWIMNLSLNKWNKIDLPQSVCGRCAHSLSIVTMKRNTEWLLITGGRGIGYSPISGVDVTVIVEIEYVSGQWVVRGMWNSTQKEELTERMKKLRPERTAGRNEEEIAHLQQEIERLAKQLTDSQQEIRKVRSDSHQLIQQAQQETRQAQQEMRQAQQETRQVRRELTEHVQQKDEVIHQTRLQIQTLQNNITANEEQIAQSAHQIQFLQNNMIVHPQ